MRDSPRACYSPPVSSAPFDRINHLPPLLHSLREAVPASASTVFGHMRLFTGRREVDVFLGAGTWTAPALSLIDWRTAPLAEVFFAHEEGETYEVEVGDRSVSGRLLQKNVLSLRAGELVAVQTPTHRIERTEADDWSASPTVPQRIPPRPPAARRPFRSPLEVTLDAAQQRVVDLPDHRSVLLLGEAGFGKTTVALHRMVALQQRATRGFKGAVIVPTEGLRRLTSLMLERRGVRGIEVFTYEAWASSVTRRIFAGLPKRESVNVTTGVSRLKRHPALREVMRAYLEARPRPALDDDRPVKTKLGATRYDLHHLFGDRAYMDRVVAASNGALVPAAAAEVTEHTKIQFSNTTEMDMAHVREDALQTIDGGRIDEGTPMEDAHSIDAEDYAVLFELERMRSQARGEAPVQVGKWDCLLIDEAQEFAPLELALMGRALKPNGTVIVAGDAAQQVDPTSFFGGWDQVMVELGRPQAHRATLEVNYRCPPDVTELARSVLDGRTRPLPAEPSILRSQHESVFHLAVWLTDALRALESEDPSASITVICRTSEAARSFERMLRHGTGARLALEGDFEFRPGLAVTSVPEVKGLEFDYVIVPDAAHTTYTPTADARRALYVAVTRATHRLALAAAGDFSPLLISNARPADQMTAASAPAP